MHSPSVTYCNVCAASVSLQPQQSQQKPLSRAGAGSGNDSDDSDDDDDEGGDAPLIAVYRMLEEKDAARGDEGISESEL